MRPDRAWSLQLELAVDCTHPDMACKLVPQDMYNAAINLVKTVEPVCL